MMLADPRRVLLVAAVVLVMAVGAWLGNGDDPDQASEPEPEIAATDQRTAEAAEPAEPEQAPVDIRAAHRTAGQFTVAYLDRASDQPHAEWHAAMVPHMTDGLAAQLAESRDTGTAHADDSEWNHDPELVGVQTTTSRQRRVEVIVLADIHVTDHDGTRTVPTRLGVAVVDDNGTWRVDDIQ